MKKCREEITKLYIALMFSFLPLYYSDNYYNILHDKRDIYVIFSLGFLAILGLLGITQLLILHLSKSNSIKETITDTLCPLDIAVVLFAAVALVSSALSGEFMISFTGEEAWDVGAGVILLTTAVYFAVSRNFSGRPDVWFYIYAGSMAVLLIGIIDRLGYDFLIMHDEIPLQYEIFISTIGNVNFWSGYLSMLVPIFALAPVFFKRRISRLFAYIFVLLAYFSCFITLTNTTYIGIGCGMCYVVWYSLRKKTRWKNLAVNMILFLLAGIAADFLWKHNVTPRAIDTDSITLLLLEYRLYIPVGIAGAVLLLYAVLANGEQERLCVIASRSWLGILVLGCCAVVVYLVRNFSLELFNYRGSIWYFSWMGYLDGSVKDKILGVGPGLLDYVTQAQIAKAPFEVVWDWYYNTAHNEVLEYLVTTGLVGAVVKVGMFVWVFVDGGLRMRTHRTARKGKSAMGIDGTVQDDAECGLEGTGRIELEKGYQAERAAIVAGVAGYVGQGFVTGPYVLNYVVYMVLVALSVGYARIGNNKQIIRYSW